jgi:succinate dehydrogenase / fumarate reductase, cytochrome b subunit
MPDRPLSPHLSVYKFKYTLVSSILNRITGGALSVGFLVLIIWLMALFMGPATYASVEMAFAHPLFKLLLSGFIFAFCYHFIAGLRHLVWDTGRGLERSQSQKSAWAVGVLSVLLTLVVVYLAFCPEAVR